MYPTKTSTRWNMPGAIVAFGILCAVLLLGEATQAQTFTVLHDFTGGAGGAFPKGNLAMDGGGNIYGTTRDPDGTVYKLSFRQSWVFNLLYTFQGGSDGVDPQAGVVFGPDGRLYGTTWNGGGQGCTLGCGTVFTLRPTSTVPRFVMTPWNETVIHRFQGPPDGQNPANGGLVFDRSGVAYGTTPFGGNQSGCSRASCGTVYKLTGSGDQRTESVLYAFAGDPDGAQPYGGVVLDNAGNLYGTTYQGGKYGYGTVFELTPRARDGRKPRFTNSLEEPMEDYLLPACSAIVMETFTEAPL